MINQGNDAGSQFAFEQYLYFLLRRKWLIIYVAVPFLLAGILFCLVSPKRYRTSTTIVVVPQKVPEAYVRTTVTGDVSERIEGIWQAVTSRTNLEKVIFDFNLYPELRSFLPMESVVEHMRRHIDISRPRSARRTAFVLSYEGKDPVLITKVANALANMFVEENLKLRESQAKSTAEFLATQLETVARELKQREEALKEYKTAHMGELPEQRQSNLAMLDRLTQQLETIQENLRRAEDRKLLLQRQLVDERENAMRRLATSGTFNTSSGSGRSNDGTVTVDDLRAKLKALRNRYTDEHPDVIALKRLLAELQRQGVENSVANKQSNGDKPIGNEVVDSPVISGLKYQIKGIALEIKALNEESRKIRREIAKYQQRVEAAPKREQELLDLTRDYNNLRDTYQDLLRRKIEAEQAQALEQKQKGEQFRIVDPARIPERPFKPDVRKILLLSIVVGFGAGIGLSFLIEYWRKPFYDPDHIEKTLDLPVLASIPYLLSPAEKRRKRLKTFCLTAGACLSYSVVGVLALLLWRKGVGFLSGMF